MKYWHSLLLGERYEEEEEIPPAPANLQKYISNAILPEMPVSQHAPQLVSQNHQSHMNTLNVRPETWRALETVKFLTGNYFSKCAGEFCSAHVPARDLGVPNIDHSIGDQITVPCPNLFQVQEPNLGQPADISHVCGWVSQMVLDTLQRICHLSLPLTTDWSFNQMTLEDYMDSHLLRWFAWSRVFHDGRMTQSALAVFVQPPWILSQKDLELFASCTGLPPMGVDGSIPEYRSKHRLWSKIWDCCRTKDCHWFVLTNYSGWVFGAFSRGWTTAYVTHVFDYDESSPTILQCLMYWLGSSLGYRRGWKIPEGIEPIVDVDLPTSNQMKPSYLEVTPSLSSWDANSEVVLENSLSVAGDDEIARLRLSPTGVKHLPLPSVPDSLPMIPGLRESVLRWNRDVLKRDAALPSTYWTSRHNTPSVGAPTEYSENTDASTVKDFTERNDVVTTGAFLTSNPVEPLRPEVY